MLETEEFILKQIHVVPVNRCSDVFPVFTRRSAAAYLSSRIQSSNFHPSEVEFDAKDCKAVGRLCCDWEHIHHFFHMTGNSTAGFILPLEALQKPENS